MTPVNKGRRFNKVAKISRNALLASTVLLSASSFAWANEVFDGQGNSITENRNIDGRVYVGEDSSGDLTISNGAVVTSSDGYIAANADYTGILTVKGDATRWENSSSTIVGLRGYGQLNIEDGAVVKNNFGYISQLPGSSGEVNVYGPGSTWINTILFSVGNGTLNIRDGGRVESNGGAIGNSSGTEGTINVIGHGSKWINSGDVSVGSYGNGTLNIEQGGIVDNTTGYIGHYSDYNSVIPAASTGKVTVSGPESLWNNSGKLYIGYEGNGELTISDEAVVTVGTRMSNGSYDGTTYIAYQDGSTGTLNIGAAETNIAAAAGTLKTETIKFGSNTTTGRIVFNHTDSNYTFAAGINGYGNISHVAGVTTLSGDSTNFFGTTNVTGGTLLVSNVLGGMIKASYGGTIGGTGIIGSTVISDGGILSPGGLETVMWARASTFGAPYYNQIGTLTINGDLTLKNGSTYAVDLSGADSDLVSANKASIEDGAKVKVTSLDSATSYQTEQQYKIIETANGLDGKFSDILNTASAFLDIKTSYDENNAYLNVAVKKAGFSHVARTGNQKSLAGALDSLDQTPGSASLDLYNALLPLGEEEALQAYQQLSGDVYATAQGAFTQTNRAVNTALNSRVRAVTDGVAAPSSMALGYAEEKKAAKDERFAAFENKEAFDTDRFATWVNGFGSWGKVSGVDGGSDTDTVNGGVIFGGDMMVGNDWRVGVLGGYSRSFFDTASSNGASTNYHLGGYAGTKWGPVAFRTGLNYTWHNVDTSRHITALNQTLLGDYDASSFNAYGELAYRLDVGQSALEPFAALAHSRTRTDGFSETGGTAALTVDGSSMNTTFTTVGLRASTDLDIAGVPSVARGTIGWMHAFGDVDPVSSARFLTGDSFSVSSTPIDRNAAVLEAGVDFMITPASTLSLTYNGQIGSNAYDHGANAKFRVKF